MNLEQWSYPYIFVYGNFIPLALILLLVICFIILVYCFIIFIKRIRSHENVNIVINRNKNITRNLLFYLISVVLLFAFAETDHKYIIYKAIVNLAITIRQIDVFLYSVILVLMVMSIKYKNSYTYQNKIIKYIIYLNIAELFMTIFLRYEVGQKGFSFMCTKIIFVVFIILLNSFMMDIEFSNYNWTSKEYLVGNNNENEEKLFEVRELQLHEILQKILTYSSDDPMTIFISDEWGSGKTFFSKYLLRQIEKTNVFVTVQISMIDFNVEETLIRQVFKRIQIALQKQGYYTGGSSEIEKYLETVLNLTLEKSMADFFSSHLNKRKKNSLESYTSLTEAINEFSKMLGKEKIIIMIDDLDRCTEETITAAVKLFSEIIFLPKSIIVFTGDYKQLLSRKEFENGFFDKYFMYNYNLKSVPYQYLLEHYQKKYNFSNFDIDVEEDFLHTQITAMIDKIERIIHNQTEANIKISRNIKESRLKDISINQGSALVGNIEDSLPELKQKLSNPRRIIRIYNEVYEQIKRLSEALKDEEILNTNEGTQQLNEVIFPAILFYSIARTICTERFWGICADDYMNFKSDIINAITDIHNNHTDMSTENKIYMLLAYTYFSSSVNSDTRIINKVSEYYKTNNIKEYFGQLT